MNDAGGVSRMAVNRAGETPVKITLIDSDLI